MSNSLWLHALQHARLLCPPLSPRVCSNWCPLSWQCYLTISFSVAPSFFCLQFFPSSGSFPISHPLASGGQSIGASASVSVLPMNIQGWLHLGLTGLISLLSKALSRVGLLKHHNWKSSVLQGFNGPTLTSIHYGKNHSFDYMDLCQWSDVSVF